MAPPSSTVVVVVVVGVGEDTEAMYRVWYIDTFSTHFGICREPLRGLYSQGLYRNVENECGLEFVVNYEIAIHFHLL